MLRANATLVHMTNTQTAPPRNLDAANEWIVEARVGLDKMLGFRWAESAALPQAVSSQNRSCRTAAVVS